MTKLIAAVATAVLIDGVRIVIPPGQELPDLEAHDARELRASGAAVDPAAQAKQERSDERARQKGEAEFEEARKAVQEHQASTGEGPAASPPAKSTAKRR